jgi:hypothetical protein
MARLFKDCVSAIVDGEEHYVIIQDVQELVRIAVAMENVTVHCMSVLVIVDGPGMVVRSLIVLEILTV